MGLSDPWDDSLDIIALQTVQKWSGINPMGLNVPWSNSIGIIVVQTAKKVLEGLTQHALVPLGLNLL